MNSLTPTGTCWCGCGSKVSPGVFFLTGHDKKATGDLDAIRHGGSVAQRLADHGYGPDGRNLHEHAIQQGVRERCGFDGCNVSGVPESAALRKHRAGHVPAPEKHQIEIDCADDEGAVQTLYAELDEATHQQVLGAQRKGAEAFVMVYARLRRDSELFPRVLRGDLIRRVEPF